MENKQTAVEWLIKEIESLITIETFQRWKVLKEQAKQMEKEQERQKLIYMLDWMNRVAAHNPMAFETDHDDIVDMYLNGYYGK